MTGPENVPNQTDPYRTQIYARMAEKDTQDLLDIWQTHDLNTWREEVFEVVHDLLVERLDEIPDQVDQSNPAEKPSPMGWKMVRPWQPESAVRVANVLKDLAKLIVGLGALALIIELVALFSSLGFGIASGLGPAPVVLGTILLTIIFIVGLSSLLHALSEALQLLVQIEANTHSGMFAA